MTRTCLLTAIIAMLVSSPAFAKDAGVFLVRLGNDTTAVERYVRTSKRLEVHQVGRAPRLLRRHFVYDLDHDRVKRLSVVVTPPDSDTPTQTIAATFQDSARIAIDTPGRPTQTVTLVVPRDAVVVSTSSPWTGYEAAIQRLMKSRSDSLRTTIYFLGGDQVYWMSLHRVGRDSVAVANGHLDVFRARVDKSGHILGMRPIAGTGKFTVERRDDLDVDAMTATFVAREKAGASLGTLSPRDSVVTSVAGASLWIDYGRPAKRGRVVFGNVVPYGELWRTGANAATQFRTDKALNFGGTTIPAGFYTLWTVPTAQGWKLIVNGQTGQWGTEHDAARDIATIDMKVETLPLPEERFTIRVEPAEGGGVLRMDWDTTRASAPFQVVP